jgi:sulfate/thiosulfate transport system substrate-binding protein
MRVSTGRRIRAAAGSSIAVGLALALVACSPEGSVRQDGKVRKKDVQITLVGFAVPKAAYSKILPKFAAKWEKEQNQQVSFRQTYGGSGSQTRATIDGLPADIVHLALASDVNKLAKAGLVDANWQQKLPNNGIVARSTAAIITRPGNPKQINTFDDLNRKDVKWVTADPKTSGGARWNILALWHNAIAGGKDEQKAIEYLNRAYQNVAVSAKDAREANDAFLKQGQGDAVLNYENEAILAKQKGLKLDYIVPQTNISIDTPIAIVDKNVAKHDNRKVVEAFAKYLFEPEAQAEFIKLGFRPAIEPKTPDPQFPKIKNLATIDRYGGWKEFQPKFFNDNGLFDRIRQRK